MIQRRWAGLLCVLCSASAPSAFSQTPIFCTTSTIARSGPSSSYAKVGSIPWGQAYGAIGKANGDWTIWDNGKAAWTSAGYHRVQYGLTALKALTDVVYLRTGPGTGYAIAGMIYKGQLHRWVISSGMSSHPAWYRIYWKGATAYVYSGSVQKVVLLGSAGAAAISRSLKMTWYKQTTGYYCGPTTVQIMARYFTGAYYVQSTLAAWLGTTSTSGTRTDYTCNGIVQFAKQPYVITYTYSRDRIVNNLNLNCPVPIAFDCRYIKYCKNSNGAQSTARHISPIKGYTSGGYLLHDTMWGPDRWASNTEVYNGGTYLPYGPVVMVRYE